MLEQFTKWLVDLVRAAFTAAWNFLSDLVVWAVGGIADVFASVVEAIPVPDFIAGGLNSVFASVDGSIMYFVVALGVPQGLAMIGAAYSFRLVRKFVTLFQW